MAKSVGDIRRKYTNQARSLAEDYHAYLMTGNMDTFKRAVKHKDEYFSMLIADEEEYGEVLEKEHGTGNFTEVVQSARYRGFGEYEHEIQKITNVIEKFFIYDDGYEELKKNGHLTPKGDLKEYAKKYNLKDKSDGIPVYKEIIKQFTETYKKGMANVKNSVEKRNENTKQVNKMLQVIGNKLRHIKEGDKYYFALSEGDDVLLFIFQKNKESTLRAIIRENNKIVELRYSEKGVEKRTLQRLPNGTRDKIEALNA